MKWKIDDIDLFGVFESIARTKSLGLYPNLEKEKLSDLEFLFQLKDWNLIEINRVNSQEMDSPKCIRIDFTSKGEDVYQNIKKIVR
ncbi:MAG: hypothetical protein EPN82_06070 [Bacteroidetes bacterium]|nr:MAG: hypothetical protein EPN82_06070 [Bacteroidota bacterium]